VSCIFSYMFSHPRLEKTLSYRWLHLEFPSKSSCFNS
jgi:hypothetical protein